MRRRKGGGDMGLHHAYFPSTRHTWPSLTAEESSESESDSDSEEEEEEEDDDDDDESDEEDDDELDTEGLV